MTQSMFDIISITELSLQQSVQRCSLQVPRYYIHTSIIEYCGVLRCAITQRVSFMSLCVFDFWHLPTANEMPLQLKLIIRFRPFVRSYV